MIESNPNFRSRSPMLRPLAVFALRAAMLSVAVSSVVSAQGSGRLSDVSGPGGGGGGTTGGVAPIGLPVGPTPATPLSTNAAAAAANIVTLFGGAGGVSVSNPAGGTVTVPAAAAQAIANLLSGGRGGAGANAVSTLTSLLTAGGIPAGQASGLANALSALGASPNLATLQAAINAYNAAIDALPAGASPPPALLGVRFALASMSR